VILLDQHDDVIDRIVFAAKRAHVNGRVDDAAVAAEESLV
jgi:hypothetical protein